MPGYHGRHADDLFVSGLFQGEAVESSASCRYMHAHLIRMRVCPSAKAARIA